MTMPQVRPSKLPLAHACPSSLDPAEHPISSESEASDIGQAQHYGAGALVLGKPYDVAAIAQSYAVDPDELAILMAQTARAWAYLSRWFPAPRVEYPIRSELLGGGTADVVEHNGDTAAVNDWKSGRVMRSYRWQAWGYAYNLRETLGMPRSGRIDSAVSWVRTGDVEHYAFTDRELDAMADAHRSLATRIGRIYSPGEHCGFCPRIYECGAYHDAVRTTGEILIHPQGYEMALDDLVRLYPKAKLLEHALETYNAILKARLAGGNRLPIGDGRVLYLSEMARTQLDPSRAIEAMRKLGWSDDDIASCIDVSKGRAEDIAEAQGRATKVKGAIKAAREKLVETLTQAGAITKVMYQRLTAAKEESDGQRQLTE